MRLPRAHSMNQRVEFSRTRTTGQAKAGRFVVVSLLRDETLTRLKVGLITTRKAGKAHDRNRFRRRIRMLIQENAPRFLSQHAYLVTIARAGATQASFEEIQADWLKQIKRLGLFAS